MELKRWCPSFKILTYYGNQKERKLKRQVRRGFSFITANKETESNIVC